jgi:hypothetical protein
VYQAFDYVRPPTLSFRRVWPTVYGAMWLSGLDLFTYSPVHAQVCFDRPVQTVLNPCGHEALCKRVRDCNATRCSVKPASLTERVGLPHLRRDWALSLPHLRRDWTLSLPHLRRDWAHPCHITYATSAPGLDSRVSAITATHRPMRCTAAALSAVLTEAQRMPDLPETRAEPSVVCVASCMLHRVCCIGCVASCVLHCAASCMLHRVC